MIATARVHIFKLISVSCRGENPPDGASNADRKVDRVGSAAVPGIGLVETRSRRAQQLPPRAFVCTLAHRSHAMNAATTPRIATAATALSMQAGRQKLAND
jgi:hypothetical protein